jgi:hypothetical protein
MDYLELPEITPVTPWMGADWDFPVTIVEMVEFINESTLAVFT